MHYRKYLTNHDRKLPMTKYIYPWTDFFQKCTVFLFVLWTDEIYFCTSCYEENERDLLKILTPALISVAFSGTYGEEGKYL